MRIHVSPTLVLPRMALVRIGASAAETAGKLLGKHGIKELKFFIVTCSAKEDVDTWKKLESALLLTFKHKYGEVPKCNTKGKNMSWADELEYFTKPRLEAVIDQYSTLA